MHLFQWPLLALLVAVSRCGTSGGYRDSVKVTRQFTQSLFNRLRNSSNVHGSSDLQQRTTMNPKEFSTLTNLLGISQSPIHKERGHFNCAHSEALTHSTISQCFDIFQPLSYSKFESVCPALIDSIVARKLSCDHSHQHATPVTRSDARSDDKSALKRYFLAIGCTFLICLSSIAGIFLFPLMPASYYNSLTSFLSSLAVGTLAGDALFHLIPQAYGLHSHQIDDHSHDHRHCTGHHAEEVVGQADYLQKTIVVILGIYLFYLIDVLTSRLPGGHEASHHHHHRPITNRIDGTPRPRNSTSMENEDPENKDDHLQPSRLPMQGAKQINVRDPSNTLRFRARQFLSSVKYVQRYAWAVLIADSIHNVSDGVTIGVAFGVSVELGLTTALAVLLHELPHELGDYAILVTSGFTHMQALFFNLITALTAYIGLLAGFLLSSSSNAAQQWTLAAAAGIFLYVALVDLFPLLLPSPETTKWNILLHNAGLLAGFAVMFLIARYEHDIKIKL